MVSVMQPTNKLREKFLAAFDELIAEGQGICGNSTVTPSQEYRLTGRMIRVPETRSVDYQTVLKWKTNCLAMLANIIPQEHVLWAVVEGIRTLGADQRELKAAIASLMALKESFEKGFLSDIALQIEAEIASDYMGQAESLLREGQSGQFDHVPAAVLAGAVLEKALRTLCGKQQPSVPTTKANDEPKALNLLIDDLKKAGVFNEMKAKQLRSWAAIRNHAAHGEFDQFTRGDVEQMLPGINNFLADYLN